MFDIEEIEDFKDGRWFSVINNMNIYRVGGQYGDEVEDQEGNEVKDEEFKQTLIDKVADFIAKEK